MTSKPFRLSLLVGCLVAAAGAMIAIPVVAAELKRVAGHTVEVKKNKKSGEEALVVDGRELHTNQYVNLDDAYAFDGTNALVGSSSEGGNMCDSSPFVLSFPAGGGAPRLDGPLDSCATVTH